MIISEQTKSCPLIEVNRKKGLFILKGRSMPENPELLYKPLIDFSKKYCKNPLKETRVIFNLEFVNSTSLRYLTLFIRSFEFDCKDCNIIFEWNSDGFEQVLPQAYKPEEFFKILTENLHCKKELIMKTRSDLLCREKVERIQF